MDPQVRLHITRVSREDFQGSLRMGGAWQGGAEARQAHPQARRRRGLECCNWSSDHQ